MRSKEAAADAIRIFLSNDQIKSPDGSNYQ